MLENKEKFTITIIILNFPYSSLTTNSQISKVDNWFEKYFNFLIKMSIAKLLLLIEGLQFVEFGLLEGELELGEDLLELGDIVED